MVAKAKKSRSNYSSPTKCKLLFKVGKDTPKWYLVQESGVPSSLKNANAKYDKQQCEEVYRSECHLYQTLYEQEQSSDYQWLQISLSTTSKVT